MFLDFNDPQNGNMGVSPAGICVGCENICFLKCSESCSSNCADDCSMACQVSCSFNARIT